MKKLALVISVICTLSATLVTPVAADPADVSLSQEQLTTIANNCLDAQSQLQRNQRTDAVTRTNRGRAYDAIIRLMSAFNSRVALNKASAPKLTDNTTALQRKFEQFYNDFTKYDSSMTSAIRVPCRTQPAVFYATLTQTRGLRLQLANDIKDMDKIVDEYSAAVNELKATIVKTPTQNGATQ